MFCMMHRVAHTHLLHAHTHPGGASWVGCKGPWYWDPSTRSSSEEVEAAAGWEEGTNRLSLVGGADLWCSLSVAQKSRPAALGGEGAFQGWKVRTTECQLVNSVWILLLVVVQVLLFAERNKLPGLRRLLEAGGAQVLRWATQHSSCPG